MTNIAFNNQLIFGTCKEPNKIISSGFPIFNSVEDRFWENYSRKNNA